MFMESMPEYHIDKQDTEGKGYIQCVHGDYAWIKQDTEGKARSADRLKPVIFQIIVT